MKMHIGCLQIIGKVLNQLGGREGRIFVVIVASCVVLRSDMTRVDPAY